MLQQISPDLRQELERQVAARTGGRIRDLAIELRPGRVTLRGEAMSWHVKQLAQHGVRDILPSIELCNAIVVQN